jgi:hypothetical protein
LQAILVQERESLISDHFAACHIRSGKRGTIFSHRAREHRAFLCTRLAPVNPIMSKRFRKLHLVAGRLRRCRLPTCSANMCAGWIWQWRHGTFSTPEFRTRAKSGWFPRFKLQGRGCREQTALVYHRDSLRPPCQPYAPLSVLLGLCDSSLAVLSCPSESDCPFRHVSPWSSRSKLLFKLDLVPGFLFG